MLAIYTPSTIYTTENPCVFTVNEKRVIFVFLKFCFFFHRAQERSAWRQARMKSLEQDALQAQKMIQSMNELADDILDSKNEVILCLTN